MTDKPVVLFACVHNSGRSVAARVLTEHYAGSAVQARSAGSEPTASVNPVVAQVLAERGLSTEDETPTQLDWDTVQAADVVVTMGCGETCPVFPRQAVRRVVRGRPSRARTSWSYAASWARSTVGSARC